MPAIPQGTKVAVINRRLSYNKKRYEVGDVFDTLEPEHAAALIFMRRVSNYSEDGTKLDNFERNLKEQFLKDAAAKAKAQEVAAEETKEEEKLEIERKEEVKVKPEKSEKPKSNAQLRKEMLADMIADV